MSNGNRRLGRTVEPICGVGIVTCRLHLAQRSGIGVGQALAEIHKLKVLANVGLEQKRHSWSGNLHILRYHRQKGCQKADNERILK